MEVIANIGIVMGPLFLFGGLVWRAAGPPRSDSRDEQFENFLWYVAKPMMLLGLLLTIAGVVAMLAR